MRILTSPLPSFSPPGNDARWSWSALPLHLLLIHLFFAPLTWNFPSWSLSGEMYGSAVLGPLLRIARKARRATALGALSLGSALVLLLK